jgi:hypothetical protein
MGLRSNGCFVISVALMGSHYKTYVISSVCHSRLDSIRLLVLWTVAYNICGTGVVLQVPRDIANPTENR